MKARFLALFLLPVALLASCRQEEPEVPVDIPEEIAAPADSVWTITIQATKEDTQTKALDLVNDGARLNAYWRSTERVKVYKDGALIGTLDVMPGSGEKPVSATLSGTITTAGLSAGNELTLRIPNEYWDYTAQLGTLADIESNYDYATATVTIDSVDELNYTVTTTDVATFVNEQSVYRFGFKVSEVYIDPKSFTISASNGLLVTERTLSGSAWASAFGAIGVTPASAPGDHFYYVALRNESTAEDTYSFIITGSDDALYMATKVIPASVLAVPGKFISAKSVSAVQPDFSPVEGSTNTAL